MAQNNQQVLQSILGVVTQINKKMDGGKVTGDGTAGGGDKSDKGTGPLSGMFGKGADTKKAKEASNVIKDVFQSITSFSKVKINARKINATSKALRGLFDVVIYIGRKRKIVLNAIRMFKVLTKSLVVMVQFATAMSTLLMAVGASILMIAGGIALAGVMLGTKGKPMATIGVIVAVIAGLALGLVLLGKVAKWVKPGAKAADKMGDAMKSLGIGLVVFVGSWLLISRMMKFSPGPKGMAMGALAIVGVIAGMALVFAGLGKFAVPIGKGTAVATGMGIGMAALALGVLAFVAVAQMITSMTTKGDAVNKKGEKKGKFGQMMANIGPGLGAMGIVLVSAGLLFAGLGALSWLIIPGVIAGLAVAGGMVLFALATKKLVEISNSLGKPEDVKETISGMVSSVLTGLIDGVSESLNPGGKKGIKGFGAAVKNQAILMNGIALLMGVSVALSMFAYSLTAFANLDNMKVIESYDEKTGKPKFGPTVNIEGVGDTIKKTLVNFLIGDGNGGLIGATSGLTKKHAKAIKAMGRALTGRRGMLTAVIQFADVLKTFAQFGPKGEIGYVEMVPDGTDEDGNAKFKQVPHSIKILDVTKVITDSIGKFSTGIAEGVTGISRRDSRKILNMSKALMGKQRGEKSRRADKPGLLEPINAFSETLTMYAKFGEDGAIPVFDADGNIIGKPVPIEKIVKNIVKAISEFSTQLSTQLSEPGQSVKDAQKRMEGYMGLVTQLSELSTAADGLDRTAESIMSLATSMGALADNVNKFEFDKLKVFAEIAKENKGIGGMMSNIQAKGDERRESRNERQETRIAAKTGSSTTTTTVTPGGSEINIEALANAIGTTVASAFKNGQFTFEFATDKSGVLNFS